MRRGMPGATVEPFLGGRFGYLKTGAFTETGAGAANLSSAGETYQAMDLVLGFRLGAIAACAMPTCNCNRSERDRRALSARRESVPRQ